ncbi:hypothetical protein [Bacillus sp. T33-2]|uniref:hypothetical protein n=1 Tax=Bacillus sp. T33-2 TaxID=2054168 RepID=UPI000C76960E|nr:hypothetical protein [Bacillus sp. T33-2]PLR94594.1 hypothetical protein CVD19_16610 [Bacillus sp. T33-2]
MLRNVLAGYVETLRERDFDIPLLCILLKNEFFDIHFLHGAFEFGKDFIAKKQEGDKIIQYVFQSKGGNIGLADFGQVRWQLEEARMNPIAHPSFNTEIERRVVLVTTGRLVGGASASAQTYKKWCLEHGNMGFQVWDVDYLLGMMLKEGANPYGLIEENPEFLSMVVNMKQGKGTFKEIEQYSRIWFEKCRNGTKRSYFGAVLESAIFAYELKNTGRTLLACYVSLFPIRAIVHALHEKNEGLPRWIHEVFHLIHDHFLCCSENLIETLMKYKEEDESIFNRHIGGVHVFVAYPVICSQSMEILGLAGLLKLRRNEMEKAKEIGNLLATLLEKNSGFFSPISDRFAVSMIPAVILLHEFDRNEVIRSLISRTAIWLCNRYEISELGLASSYAAEEDEINTLLGYAYDFIKLPARRESYLGTVLIDLTAILGLNDLYEDILNDILAVEILPCNIVTKDTVDKYMLNGASVYTPVIRFKDSLSSERAWRDGVEEEAEETFCLKNDMWWELLAIISILRDRHFVNELSAIVS